MSKEIKDMIDKIPFYEYTISGGRGYGKSYIAEIIKEKDKEIERLNNIINELEKNIKEEIKRTEELIKDDFNHSTGSIAQVRKMLNADRENWLFILEKLKENK